MILVVGDVLVVVVGTSVPAARFTPEKVEDKEFPPTRNVSVPYCQTCIKLFSNIKYLIWKGLYSTKYN